MKKDMSTAAYISHLERLTSEIQGELKEKEEDLFNARQALLTQGLELRVSQLHDEATGKHCMFMRRKIECALSCHPNAVKYLLDEALGGRVE